MTPKDWVGTALRALADHDRGREAPEEVENRLLAAFRRRRARKKTKTVALATLAVAAAITLFFARTQPRPAQIRTDTSETTARGSCCCTPSGAEGCAKGAPEPAAA